MEISDKKGHTYQDINAMVLGILGSSETPTVNSVPAVVGGIGVNLSLSTLNKVDEWM